MKDVRIQLYACSLVTIALLAAVAPAQSLFIDDFEDGNAMDGSPVSWTPLAGYLDGDFKVEQGSFVFKPRTAEAPLVATTENLTAVDVSIRSQFQSTGAVDGIGLFARLSGPNTYQGGIDTDGLAYIGWNDPTYHDLVSVLTDLRPIQEDVVVQFDVIGDQLALYAWPASERRPELPLLSTVDTRFTAAGRIGLLNDPMNSSNVSFHYVQAATASIPVPEPIALLACAGGCLALILARRKRRRSLTPRIVVLKFVSHDAL